MSNITTKQSVLLKGLSKKTVVAQFDQDHASADGGAVLLKACDERLGLSASLAACLSDKRQPGKVKHSLQELFQQRMFGIATGYAEHTLLKQLLQGVLDFTWLPIIRQAGRE